LIHAGQGIEEGGFASVGIADQGYGGSAHVAGSVGCLA
jgi:hypothetical protein